MSKYEKYFEEIRKRIIVVAVVSLIGLVLGFLFSNKILIFCLNVFNFSGVNITMTSPSQLIDLSLYTAVFCGILLGLPTMLYETIQFVRPAFTKHEYSLVKRVLPGTIVLFLLGVFFGAWVIQFVIRMYSKFSNEFQVSNMWDIQKFFSQVVMTALLTGVIFQMPVVLTILIRLGLVTRKFLSRQRRYVYAILLVVSVLLPPTDILSLILLTVPLLFLFEVALLLNIDRA